MKTAKLTAILLFLLFAIALPAITMAAVIGKITALQGDVDVLKPGMERAAPAAVQQPVSEGDIVRTKSTGKTEITFVDESVIRLAPNSRLQITEYLMEGNKRKSGVMNLFRGKMRAVVSKSRGFLAAAFGEGEKFEVRTPTAVAGVRGTDFFVSYSMGVTGIMVKEGRVDAFNPAMPGQVVLVTEGNATFIAENKPPSPPRPANDVEMIRYTRDTDVSEKPKEDEGTITADAGTTPPAGETFGYEAPEGIEAPATDTGTVETVEIPISESNPALLADIQAPTITITPSSAYPSGTDLAAVIFNLSSNESVTYSYNLDSGVWTSTPSSLTFPTLGEGLHTLNVQATDTAGNTSSPASLSFDLSRYSLIGTASTASALFGGSVTSGEVAGVSNQNWGGWINTLTGTYTSIPTSFTLYAGGTSTDTPISNPNNSGYWLETVSVTDLGGPLSGTSSLKYLSYDRLGTGIGTFTGSYGGGTWSATDSGTYTETPLVWSGDINPDRFYYNDIYIVDPTVGVQNKGWDGGIMGSPTSPWSSGTVTYMGNYVDFGGAAYPYLWIPEIANDTTNTSFDGGAYYGFIDGVWKKDRTIDARVYSLYIDSYGNAGILKGSLAGEYYPALGMFWAEGAWTPIGLGTTTTLPANMYSGTLTLSQSNIASVTLTSSESYSTTGAGSLEYKYSITDQNQEWGIWELITGGYYNSLGTPPWSLSISNSLIGSTETTFSQWLNGQISGTTYGYGADISGTAPMTWISVGETIGTFDPTASTWQAVQTGAWLDTNKFLGMACPGGKCNTTGTPVTPDENTLASLNIPFVEVGKAHLTGNNGVNMSVTINDVIFFASKVAAAPTIWATGNITGNYDTLNAPTTGTGVNLDGINGFSGSATFTVQQWTGANWTATVTNGTGTPVGGSYTSPVNFEGAAAGNVDKDLSGNTCSGCFSGTAAGVAQ